MAGWIKMPLRMEVGFGSGDIVLDETKLPSAKPGTHPQFSALVYCGQTAGWIKIPLGTEVGLGPVDIVLDGAYLPPRGTAPNFRPMSIMANGRHLTYC